MPEVKERRSGSPVGPPVNPRAPAAPARRRLLHGAAPVLMTLVSRPVLGAVQCVTPSVFCSGNLSVAGDVVVCQGKTPGQWIADPSWPPPFTPDTPFNTVFGPNPQYACDTLLDVLLPSDNSAPSADTPAPVRTHHRTLRDMLLGKAQDKAGTSRGPEARGGQPAPRTPGSALPSNQLAGVQSEVNAGGVSGAGTVGDPTIPRFQSAPRTAGSGVTSNQLAGLRGQPSSGGVSGHPLPSWFKRKGQGQETPPTPQPAAPVPGPVDPLGCNNNSETPASTEPSSPGTTPTARGRRRHPWFSRGSRPQDAVARHIVSALLNAQAGLTPGLPVGTVKGMWSEYVTKGYFEPTAGVQWNAQDIVTYLVSTQPV